MKVSYNWLQKYIKEPLPSPQELESLLTKHSFEIEEVALQETGDTTIDVDVLNNRAHDCLCHYGIAREIALITGLTFVSPVTPRDFTTAPDLQNVLEGPICRRLMTVKIEGIDNIIETPQEIKQALESIGERSINFVVDVTNFVMYELGQPMHAYDASKVDGPIVVRQAQKEESITTLDNKVVTLNPEIAVVADASGALAIAGVKGGKKAEVTKETNAIILEAANFSGVAVRETVKMTGIRTDSSKRFENEITPKFISGAMSRAIELIEKYTTSKITITGCSDVFPRKLKAYRVGVSLIEVNKRLGTALTDSEVEKYLQRLGFSFKKVNPREVFLATVENALGAPYKYGASVLNDSPKAFDCSSLTAYAAVEAGISIPRMVVDQYVWGTPIEEKDLEVGDIIFSNVAKGGHIIHRDASYESIEFLTGTKVPEGVDHMGVYVGDGKLIHATEESDKGVVCESIAESPRFGSMVTGYRRFITDNEERYVITVPHERLDIRRKEDVIEEIGRLFGYENIAAAPCEVDFNAHINPEYYYNTLIKKILAAEGFSEVFTYSFVKKGDIEVLKPFAKDKAFLRKDLKEGLEAALTLNEYNADLIGIRDVMIFEIGHIFVGEREIPRCAIAVRKGKGRKKPAAHIILSEMVSKIETELGVSFDVTSKEADEVVELDLTSLYEKSIEVDEYPRLPLAPEKIVYQSPSPYPFIARDIALWVSDSAERNNVEELLRLQAGELLVKLSLFDEFTKEDESGNAQTSLAYRLVFQSHEKTLSDDDAMVAMTRIYETIKRTTNWEVR